MVPRKGTAAPSPDRADDVQMGKVGILELLRYRKGVEWLWVVVGGISAFLSGGTTPLFMYFFGRLTTDAYDRTKAKDVMNTFAMLMSGVGMTSMVLSFVKTVTYMITAYRDVGRIKSAYFASLLHQDIAWHDAHKPGELISHLTGDTRLILNGINDRFAGCIESLGMGIVGFTLSFLASWELSLLILSSVPIFVVLMVILSSISSRLISITRSYYAKAGSIAQEAIENMRTVQSFNREDFESERFEDSVRQSRKAGIKKEFLSVMTGGIVMGVMIGVLGCSFFLAAYLVENNRADVGTVSATFLSILYGAMGLGQIFPSLMGFVESRTAAYPIFETVDCMPEIRLGRRDPNGNSVFEDSINFRGVKFAYPTRLDQPIFRSLDVCIKRGEKVAFSGSTGCGKSSIIALLQRFYDPQDGQVLIDGRDLRDINLWQWRQEIGIVSQEPNLFSGTIIENVRMGNPDATEEEVVRACRKARIHDTILTLPLGYETKVGSVGRQLSGGQKQRLAIARAIIRGAKVLLLDEATSALDRKSEVQVQLAIDDLTKNSKMTVITIAHRVSTIRGMDRIYFLDNNGNGSYIAEVGTYDELLKMNGRFAAMVMMQDTTAGNLRTVIHDTSFYVYPNTSESNSDSSDKDDAFSISSRSRAAFYDAEDDWSCYSDERDVPFEHRTDWELHKTSVSMWRLMKLTKGNWWAAVLGALGSILSAIVFPFVSMIFTELVNVLGTYKETGNAEKMNQELRIYIGFLIGLGGLFFCGSFLTGFYGYIGEHLTYYLRTHLFLQILRQDQTFFDMPDRDPGSLAAMLSGDCEAVHQLYGPTLGSRLKSVFMLFAGVAIGLYMQWKVALIAFSTMPLLVGSIIAQQLFYADANDIKKKAGIDTIVSEALGSIRTVHSFNLQHSMNQAFKRCVNEEEVVAEKRSVLISVLVSFTELALMGSMAISFWYGGTLVEKGETEFSNVLVVTMAITMATTLAGAEAGSFATKVRDARKAANNVFSIIDRVPDVDCYEYGAMAISDSVGIELKDVDFAYPARSNCAVLDELNLSFLAGTSNGLMGHTGCGKSTIIQLLARFYPADSGVVLINGVDITAIDLVAWRSHISIVLQEPSLFSGSIRDNIKYSYPEASDEEMYEAARIACIHEEVMRMEDEYDTEVGYRGQQLSGGQKQRVAIARAVLRCPRLLLLDEATSALDNATEAAVQANLDAYQQRFGVTTVAVAHRLTTIRHCNQIVLLDSGKIIEQGTHDELMEQDGEYKVRWQLTQS